MDKDYEKKYHELEATEWWFKTRREAVLKFTANLPKHSKILDVGCSSGQLLHDLERTGFKKDQLFGIDISESGINLAQASGFTNTEIMDGSNLTYPDEYFDVLISSDSLEHIEFDERALLHWFRVLKPGGTLIVFVPAFMALWSAHDIVNHHFRRYTKHTLTSKVESAGFKIEQRGYWNLFLFFPIACVRILKRNSAKELGSKKAQDDLNPTHPLLNSILKSLLRIENLLLRTLPFGVSTFCIAKKPEPEPLDKAFSKTSTFFYLFSQLKLQALYIIGIRSNKKGESSRFCFKRFVGSVESQGFPRNLEGNGFSFSSI